MITMRFWCGFIVAIWVVGMTLAGPMPAQDTGSFLLLSGQEAEAIRDAIRSGKSETAAAAARLRREADRVMALGPWSVTTHRPKDVPGIGNHDFFSEGPYWWPNPANPGGPYIRRDGERYPGRFTANDDAMIAMSEAVMTLGMAAYYLQEPRYADRASVVLSAWFLDPGTRMTPHLEFGQAIRGINTGRGTGIIETNQLIWAVRGMILLERSGYWKGAATEGVRAWFQKYLEWVTGSSKGLDEKKSGNNHSTWWTAQVAAYSIFTGDTARLQMAWRYYRDFLVPHQIRADGSCPLEEARTRSLSYSAMNLNGYALLCRMAELQGVDLWSFNTAEGLSLARAVAYLQPFMVDPSSWKKPQITPYQGGNAYFLAFAGMGLKKPEYLQRYCGKEKDDTLLHLELELLLASKQICRPAVRSNAGLSR